MLLCPFYKDHKWQIKIVRKEATTLLHKFKEKYIDLGTGAIHATNRPSRSATNQLIHAQN